MHGIIMPVLTAAPAVLVLSRVIKEKAVDVELQYNAMIEAARGIQSRCQNR
jgi:hypothetical protein